jgi:hypothetical protein
MFAACGSESVPRRDAASNDGAISDTPLPSDAAGELRIGGGTLPPPSDAELPPFTTDAPYVVVNDSCCTVVLSIADPTADETTALLEGDVAPLAATRGVPLAWADDRWSATVCLPKETLVSYRFYFGQKPRVWDVPGQDGGAGAEDGGAGEAEDAEVELVDDYRTSDEEPTTLDSSAQSWNVFAPVLTCPSPP